MTFEEILDQAIALLQRRGRVTYRTLKRQFNLDDEALADLKAEIIKGQRLAVDEDGEVLVWTGGATNSLTSTRGPSRAPLGYTPTHLVEKILTSRAALEGERKQVTVLFADLKSSMELLADRDLEEARQLLDPVLECMMAAVHRYEGTVNQVLGDGIMALFGAPIAHEDHAVRACYAALAVQEAIKSYNEEVRRTHGITVQIRVGLNSGEVIVRAIGNDLHMDYSAIGQTTHLAARMEQLATPGSILLAAETLRLAEGFVQVNALGPVPVKGLTEPVAVFELVGVTSVRRRLQATAARGLTRLVGRETELAALTQALERAGAAHGQVVAIVGEAGVGKSRLVYECLHSHRTQGWRVLEAASVSYGKATPYFPVLDLLKRYAQVDDHDDARTIRAKVTGHVLTLDEALQDTIPALLALLGALPEDSPFWHLEPPQRRQRTLEALQRLLLRESHVQPLLLVFEDLHWIDSETQALLDNLVERLPTAPLLLLVNYRPEYQHGWGSKTYYTQLRLDPLPPASAAEILQALLGDDPSLAPLKPLLIARTEGNPFFLEESVRTLVETQVLVGEPGAYRLARHVGAAPRGRPEVGNHRGLPLPIDIQVPATVQAVLAARIDRLPPADKRLLQTAAVIGHEVPMPLLQALAELPEADLHRGLAHLQAAEFLYETRLFPEREFIFKHALTHEVAYGSLLHERRRVLHAQIVEVLETAAGDRLDDRVERLAHHALRGEVWAKALAYCRQAGEKALARSAPREAVGYFEQALSALGHLPETRDTRERAIDLRFDLHHALNPLIALDQIVEHLRTAETLAEALGDQRRLGWVAFYLSDYFWKVGDLDRTFEAGQRALALAQALGDITLELEANRYLGMAYHGLGAYHRAIEVLRQGIASVERERIRGGFGLSELASANRRSHRFQQLLFNHLYWLALSLADVGAFVEAITRGEEGVQIAEALDRPYSHISALQGVGLVYIRKGDLHQAISVLERGMGLWQVVNSSSLFLPLAASLGFAYALSGRVAEALPLLEQAVEETVSRGRRAVLPQWMARLGEAYLLAGRLEDALQGAHRALELADTHKERGSRALKLLSEIHAHRDPPDVKQAEAYYRQALALADELGMRPLQAHCHHGLGTLYAKSGQREQAGAELAPAINLYRAMGMTFWLPQAEATLAAVEGR